VVDLLARARAHLHVMAHAPRPAGSAADTAARHHAADTLRALGFTTREVAFAYSAFPGRFGTPTIGTVATLLLVWAALLGAAGHAGCALGVLSTGVLVLGPAGLWLARRGVLHMPIMRATGTNLVATRGADAPRVWLMAHTDTKSQPVPSVVRAAGVGAVILAVVALTLLGALGVLRTPGPTAPWWLAAGALALLGGVPLALCTVGSRSDGALDNASGMAAVLLAAEMVPPRTPVGVVITTAEELGLAGARAWVATAASEIAVLNCDGVDDIGVLTTMYTGSRAGPVLTALAQAARDEHLRYRAMRLLPGILVDSVAVADAGLATATVSRGTLATLRRVHTAADTLEALRGNGIPEAATLLAGGVRIMSLH